ncbi:MAG TPA: hypothetical protein VKQ08_08165 [Cyclobacteriaceae bacterium]|nr:hypothetical protein [Cyclobacteriaceae bacterium]
MKPGYWIAKIAVFGIAAIGLVGYITMSLWNWLVPDLFHGPEIGFWQALGLLILSKILFFSFGGKHSGHRAHWRPYWKTKWASMSEEDRERFKQKMKEKWCFPQESPPPKDSSATNV